MCKIAFLAAFLALPLAAQAGHGARVAIVNGQAVLVAPQVVVHRQLVAVQAQPQVIVVQAQRQHPRPKPGIIRRVLKRVF